MKTFGLLLLALAACVEDEGPVPPTTPACGGARLFERPAEPSARGPWPVGVRTVRLPGIVSGAPLVVEVWYPAKLGSDAGRAKQVYDVREWLPPDDAAKIPDAESPPQVCDCYRDLPIDGRRGPFPLVVFVHGTASFRTQSLSQMTHWASRGLVVVAADYPGIGLADVLGDSFDFGNQVGDTNSLIDALESTRGELGFLSGRVDLAHLALAGHSAGGNAINAVADRPGVEVRMPLAAGGTTAGAALRSSLVMGALDDGFVSFANTTAAYDASPPRKRLVGLGNAGHLAFSDICAIGRDQGGLLAIARKNGIMVIDLVARLSQDGCGATQLPPERSATLVNFATTAVLEETLTCSSVSAAQIATIGQLPDVAQFAESL